MFANKKATVLKNGPTPAFLFFSNINFTEKTVSFLGIQTMNVGLEGEHSDYLGTVF